MYTRETQWTRQTKSLFRTRYDTSGLVVLLSVTSWSSVPPSFLVIIVMFVLFRCFLMLLVQYPKVHFSRLFKVGCVCSLKKNSSRRFFHVDIKKLKSYLRISKTVHSEKKHSTILSLVKRLPFCWLNLFLTFFVSEKIQTPKTGRSFVPVPFCVFLRDRFSNFFWLNGTSKISVMESVRYRCKFVAILWCTNSLICLNQMTLLFVTNTGRRENKER